MTKSGSFNDLRIASREPGPFTKMLTGAGFAGGRGCRGRGIFPGPSARRQRDSAPTAATMPGNPRHLLPRKRLNLPVAELGASTPCNYTTLDQTPSRTELAQPVESAGAVQAQRGQASFSALTAWSWTLPLDARIS